MPGVGRRCAPISRSSAGATTRRGAATRTRWSSAGKWDDHARLAYLQSRTGDFAAPTSSYAQAEEQISVKEMRSYAWVELQRGLL